MKRYYKYVVEKGDEWGITYEVTGKRGKLTGVTVNGVTKI